MLPACDDIDLREIVLGEPRSTHHYVGTAFERGQDVGFGGVGFGVFDEDVAGIDERFLGRTVDRTRKARLAEYLPEATARVLARNGSDESNVRSIHDGARKLRARPAGCSRQTYSDNGRCLSHVEEMTPNGSS
jgi:hypothetical protein